MPLHWNESSSQRTMSFTVQNTFVKKNCVLFGDCDTALKASSFLGALPLATQICFQKKT